MIPNSETQETIETLAHEGFEPHEIAYLETLLRRLHYLETSTRIADRHSRKEIKALRWALSMLGAVLPPAPSGLDAEIYTRGAAMRAPMAPSAGQMGGAT